MFEPRGSFIRIWISVSFLKTAMTRVNHEVALIAIMCVYIIAAEKEMRYSVSITFKYGDPEQETMDLDLSSCSGDIKDSKGLATWVQEKVLQKFVHPDFRVDRANNAKEPSVGHRPTPGAKSNRILSKGYRHFQAVVHNGSCSVLVGETRASKHASGLQTLCNRDGGIGYLVDLDSTDKKNKLAKYIRNIGIGLPIEVLIGKFNDSAPRIMSVTESDFSVEEVAPSRQFHWAICESLKNKFEGPYKDCIFTDDAMDYKLRDGWCMDEHDEGWRTAEIKSNDLANKLASYAFNMSVKLPANISVLWNENKQDDPCTYMHMVDDGVGKFKVERVVCDKGTVREHSICEKNVQGMNYFAPGAG